MKIAVNGKYILQAPLVNSFRFSKFRITLTIFQQRGKILLMQSISLSGTGAGIITRPCRVFV